MQKTTLLVVAPNNLPQLKKLSAISDAANIIVGNSVEELAQYAAEAETMLVFSKENGVLKSLFPQLTNLQWVHTWFAGLDGLLFPELVASSVPLTNARGVFARSLGEYIMTAALYFAKDLSRMNRSQRDGKWDQFVVEELAGKTLAIYGYGAIGQRAAKLAKAFEMRVVGVRRDPAKSKGDPAVDLLLPFSDRAEACAQADYFAITAPLTPETLGSIGDEELSRLQKHAVLINVGRGAVVDESALVSVLRDGRIRGAALDVFAVEPLPPEHPFYSMTNVLLSAHTADRTVTFLDESMDLFLENFGRFRRGESLLNVTDKSQGY